jgi:hypothetical protein
MSLTSLTPSFLLLLLLLFSWPPLPPPRRCPSPFQFAAERFGWGFHHEAAAFSSLTPSSSSPAIADAIPKGGALDISTGGSAADDEVPFDFVLCVLSGNDSTDRDVFDLLRRSWFDSAEEATGNRNVGGPFLATLSAKRNAHAQFHCNGRVDYLRDLLEGLVGKTPLTTHGMKSSWSGML